MLNYNAPNVGNGTNKSDIDNTAGLTSQQMATFHALKKSIIQSRKDQYFMPLAAVQNMPKHFGKTIKVFEYVPLLDDRNVNDQGLDAAGATIVVNQATGVGGNLYGSSRDIGKITSKLPTLSENGGRVNRVGFSRLTREGSIQKFGFFTEFTQESLDFDSDEDLMDHLSRELMNGAVQLTEAVLQRDLLNAAGVTVFAGVATTNATVTGEGGASASVVSYQNLMRLDQLLTDNRTPKQTKVIVGSRLQDTKTIPASRVMFVGSALVPLLKGLKDLFNNKAFIPVQQYADAGTVLNGEIGSIDSFRIIEVPEMLHWAGVGATVTSNPGYRASNTGGGNRYDVYPMLVVGDDSFTTIGFQTDGKSVKFSVMTKMPGRETADKSDPYGETGFSSIKWYYGTLIKRPERIALIKTVAPV
jgi:N4-gp56 family major capsid protein